MVLQQLCNDKLNKNWKQKLSRLMKIILFIVVNPLFIGDILLIAGAKKISKVQKRYSEKKRFEAYKIPPPVWLKPSINYQPDRNVVPTQKFVILIMSYNNKDWYHYNLDSIFSQDYPYFRVIYVDDFSQDGTCDLVASYVAENKQGYRFTLVSNNRHLTKTANIYNAMNLCDDNEIAVILDGDDWFAHRNVLTYLNEVYSTQNAWLTYGGHLPYPKGKPQYWDTISPQTIAENSFRKASITTALRSFYVWLYKQIKLEDLMYHGKFMPMAGDVAKMYPMFEMAGARFWQNTDILYIYNRLTSINDDKINRRLQLAIHTFVTQKKPYTLLAHPGIQNSIIDHVDRIVLSSQQDFSKFELTNLSKYVLLLRDNTKIPTADFVSLANLLEETGATAFFFKCSETMFIQNGYAYELIRKNIGAWQFGYGPKITHDLCSAVILRKDDMVKFLTAPAQFCATDNVGLFL